MRKVFLRILAVLSVLLVSIPAGAQWDKDVLEFRGRLALQDRKYSQAMEQFNILARLDTSNHWIFFYRGIAKYNLGDIRGAANDFDRSIRLNPLFTNGYHYRAITKSRSGDYDAALEDLRTAISLRPGMDGLYFSRGVTYFLAGEFAKAVKDFDKYIARENEDPSAYLNRGASYLFLGDTLSALSDYNKAIRLDRFEAEGYIRRARLYAASDKIPEAVKDLDYALELDSTNTLALFNRALLLFDSKRYSAAMRDMDKVLELEPGNALTLYNRSLIRSQLKDYSGALDDMDRVLNINPENVLAYFNRASIFIEMGRYSSALKDYTKAIELYPDFAKAYQNRAYVENVLGMKKESERDYKTALRKIEEYRENGSVFADTTGKFSSLIALDADFAKKGFEDELLQHRDIDIRLSPLFRLCPSPEHSENLAFSNRFEGMDSFLSSLPLRCSFSLKDSTVYSVTQGESDFSKALSEASARKFNSAVRIYGSIASSPGNSDTLRAAALLNRAVLRAEMIDFIASIQSNVQVLSMDDQGTALTRVSDRATSHADYSDAISDMQASISLCPQNPYAHYDLGNLYVLSSDAPGAILQYNKALELNPRMGEGYYNRGLVLIFLKDREKGCMDLSRAGELGIRDAYSVIGKYCKADGD